MKALALIAVCLLLASSSVFGLQKTEDQDQAPITPDTPNDEPNAANSDANAGPVEAEAVDQMTADTVMPSANEVLTDLDLSSHKQKPTQTHTQSSSTAGSSTSSLLEKDDEMESLDSTLLEASSGLSDHTPLESDDISALAHHMTNIRFRSKHEEQDQDAPTHEETDLTEAGLDAMDPAYDLNAELDSSLDVEEPEEMGDVEETAFLEMQHMDMYGADLRGPEHTTPEKAAMDSAAQAALLDSNDDEAEAEEDEADMGLDLDAEDAMDLVDANGVTDGSDKDFDSFLNEAINVGSAGLPNPVITAGSSSEAK